eukprot:gene16781-19956_t
MEVEEDDVADKRERIRQELLAKVNKAEPVAELPMVFENIKQTKSIYTLFTLSVFAMAGVALYKLPFFQEGGGSLFDAPYDPISILRDVYDDHRKLLETGSAEFNALIPTQSVMIDERYIKVSVQEDTLSFIVPILQKSSKSLIATGNIDLVKEGKNFRVCNLFVDVVNGKHFDIDIPRIKYDTTSPKYTGMMGMEQ